MYRRPKFLEVLHAIREQMSREVDYDVDLFAEMVRSGAKPTHGPERIIRGIRTRALRDAIAMQKPDPGVPGRQPGWGGTVREGAQNSIRRELFRLLVNIHERNV